MPTKTSLSVAIITLNEESNLERCLQSVQGIADEILVIDSGSTDATQEIAARYGARFEFNAWPGHVAQKNLALERATHEWVLSLDADECLTPELAQEIQALLHSKEIESASGYQLNRRTFYLGDWVRHAWYPEWRLRLVKKHLARWEGTDPHDKLMVNGSEKKLKSGDFLHYSYRDLQHHFEVSLKYARIGAEAAYKKGKRFKAHKLFTSPLGRLFKFLFIKMAWRDGWRGWIILGSSMMTAFMKQAYLLERELNKKES